jgi:hypothetical protein
MRRLLLGFPIFLVAFWVGYALVPQFRIAPVGNEPKLMEHTIQSETIPAFTAPVVQNVDFVAEFRDLTNLADVVYPTTQTKLVDLFEHGNAYRKSEVIAKSGETWLGLFEKNGKFSLKHTDVKVKLDPTYEGYGDEDYVRLKTNEGNTPVFIVKNSKSLNAGAITTVYHRPHWKEIEKRNLPIKPMAIGYKEDFYLNDNKYTLRVTPGLTLDGSRVNVLVLETGEKSQIVNYNHHYDEYDNIGDLLWVGDLDGDNKLDVYIDNYSYEKGYFWSNLFLSSEAEDDKLVKEVASFGTAGC